jgi:hypothetical protein
MLASLDGVPPMPTIVQTDSGAPEFVNAEKSSVYWPDLSKRKIT